MLQIVLGQLGFAFVGDEKNGLWGDELKRQKEKLSIK